MSTLELSVVIPCFDEMVNLQKGVLDKVEHFLGKKKYNYEVVIVDDGSKDGSVEFIEDFIEENSHFKLIKSEHMGKAGAVTKGMLEALGKHILFTDMDQATPIEQVDKLIPYFSEGYEIVIGSRSNARKGAPWTRVMMSRGNIILRKFLVGLKDISDTQCGFKMFKKEVAHTLFRKISDLHGGFHPIHGSSVTSGFDIELLYIAQKMGYKIKEVPIHWLYVETRRVSPVKDSIEGLLALFEIRKNALSGKYS